MPSRPLGKKDANGYIIPDSFQDEAFQGEYTGANLIYKGFARPGSSINEPVWQIAKLNYTGADLTSIVWPQASNGSASNDYIFTWSARATYTYS